VENVESLVPQAELDPEVILDLLDLQGNLDHQDKEVKQDQWDPQEDLDHKVLLEKEENQEELAQEENWDLQVHKETEVKQVH